MVPGEGLILVGSSMASKVEGFKELNHLTWRRPLIPIVYCLYVHRIIKWLYPQRIEPPKYEARLHQFYFELLCCIPMRVI